MRSYIDKNDKKNEIRLLFKHPLYKDKILLAVEGQTDVRLFRGILKHDRLKLETIDGKNILVELMQELVDELPNKIVAICDADFDHLRGESEGHEAYSVYVTDEHDAEVMMLKSPAFNSFILEYSSLGNSDEVLSEIFEKVFQAAYDIGILRWINTDENLGIKFKGLNFNLFVDVNKLDISIDLGCLIDQLIARSRGISDSVNTEYLLSKLEEYRKKDACKFQVCSGHDLTNIIAIIFRQKWASVDINMDYKKVESSLRIGFQKDFFYETRLFDKLCDHMTPLGLEFRQV